MNDEWFHSVTEGLIGTVEEEFYSHADRIKYEAEHSWKTRIHPKILQDFRSWERTFLQQLGSSLGRKLISEPEYERISKILREARSVIGSLKFSVAGLEGRIHHPNTRILKLLDFGSSDVPAFKLRERVFQALKQRLSAEGLEIEKDFLPR